MRPPENLKYTKEHEWVRIESDGVVTVGITHFAQDALGDVVYAETPKVGAHFTAGAEIGVVESVKAVSDIYTPVTGEVVEVNVNLDDAPETINESPYEDGWFVKIKLDDTSELDGLMDAEAYMEFCS